MFFGLTFGSGVIIAHMREGKVSPQEGRIIGTFMALCHALIEDTIIFHDSRGSFTVLIIPRAAVAFGVCVIIWSSEEERNGANGVINCLYPCAGDDGTCFSHGCRMVIYGTYYPAQTDSKPKRPSVIVEPSVF